MEKLMNIPSLRFPEFVGEWKIKKIGDEIKESGYGPRFSGEDYSVNGNVKTIRGTDISLDGEILYNQVPIANLNADFIKNHILEEGDLVMITTADCGLTGVFRKQNIDYIPSAYAVKLRLKESAYPEYFKYLFLTTIAHNQVNKFIRKATIGNLPGSDILKFEFNLPPFTEQTKIASFLTTVDDKLQALKQKKTLLDQYKKGVMQKIFSQELQFKDDNGNDYPDWEEKKLSEVANKKSSNISANKIEDNFGDYIIYGASGILKKVDFYKEENDYISIVKDGAGVGRLLYCKGQSSVLGTMEIIRPNKQIDTYYLYCLLSNIDFVKYVTGSTIPHIYFKDYSSELCRIPCLEEQTKIAHFLSAIDEKIKHCQEQITSTEVWKKGLLQQMFV